MIINLSHEIEDINKCIRHFKIPEKEQFIVDFNTTIKITSPHFFSICELDGFDELNERITRQYIKDIGFLSTYKVNGRPIVSYCISGLPLFWATDIAVKYPFISLAKTVYLLHELLPLLKAKFNGVEKVYVSIPSVYSHYMEVVKLILKDNGVPCVLFKSGSKKFSLINDVVKHLAVFQLKMSWLKLKSTSKRDNRVNGNYFITTAKLRTVDGDYKDFYYHELFTLSAKKVATHYWPMFGNFQTLAASVQLPPAYIANMPGWRKFWSLLMQVVFFGSFFKIKKIDEGLGKSLFAHKGLLEAEIRHLARTQYFAYYWGIWIKNYFTNASQGVKVFYQDEFYHTGRIITAALSKANVKTIGVQHGLFDLYHTVYGIGEMELKNPFSPLPSPDIFTVWSEWFKRYFESNNSGTDLSIKVLGSPKHFYLQQNITSVKSGLPVKILWCTDNLELTQNDLRLMESDVLINPRYQVTLRKHPLYDYMHIYTEKMKLFDKYPNLKISVNESIFDDIDQHDIVVVNCFTTAFLDAYLKGRPCIRLFPFAGSPAYLKQFKSPIIRNVTSKEEMVTAIEVLILQTPNDANDGALMDNRIAEWQCLLYN